MQTDAHIALAVGDPASGGPLPPARWGATNSQYSAVILMVHCNRSRLHGRVLVLNGPSGTIRREGNEEPLRVLPRQVRPGAAPPRVQELLLPKMRRSLQGLVA